jgi:hypothetical protein
LNTKNPNDRIRKPGRRAVLENFGYTIINKEKSPNRKKITIITDNK